MTGNMPNILDKKTTGPADLWTLDKKNIMIYFIVSTGVRNYFPKKAVWN